MAHSTFAARRADTMQLETRKKHNFDETEAALPNPKLAPTPSLGLLSASGILSHLGSRNPLPKPITGDDIVWLFDNTAFKPSRLGHWHAEFVSAVFEKEPKCTIVDIVTVIAGILGLAKDSKDYKTIEERVLPFLWDIRPGRQPRVMLKNKELKLGPTGPNGISSDVLRVPEYTPGESLEGVASVPRGTEVVGMKTFYADPEGWAVVSDIDDTIKITQTTNPTGILDETFVKDPRPIPGMPELYKMMNEHYLPENSPWFYLSASPYNLYKFLREFRGNHFPHGTIILRDASWKTIPGLLSALTVKTEEYKTDRLRKIQSWLPKRKMILIGDSTQSDPEAYGDIYRQFPGWVKGIYIRKAVELDTGTVDEKNKDERFDEAFKDVPRNVWETFVDPKVVEGYVTNLTGINR